MSLETVNQSGSSLAAMTEVISLLQIYQMVESSKEVWLLQSKIDKKNLLLIG